MAKSKAKDFTAEDGALLDELGVEAEASKTSTYTPRQERIIAGFEDIQRFVKEHGRPPKHGEDRDIFERLYAVRLDCIRASEECMELLRPMDDGGLLDAPSAPADGGIETDEELLAALGVEAEPASDVTEIKHVRPQADRKAAKEVAQRKPCDDFDKFRPIFARVQQELDEGVRQTSRFQHNGKLEPGDLFILDGQQVLVAALGEVFVTDFEREDRRLRVIFDNGTESNLLQRSLQRALYKDSTGRRILPVDAAPLFSGERDADDAESGSIYVLRSLSDNSFIAEHRDVIHKIGVTRGEIKRRIANARKEPTYLFADVELVDSYQLANVNRTKLERVLHRFLGEARIDVQLRDRFDQNVEPREWFLVPLPVIRQMIQLLTAGELEHCRYDSDSGKIIDRRTDRPYRADATSGG